MHNRMLTQSVTMLKLRQGTVAAPALSNQGCLQTALQAPRIWLPHSPKNQRALLRVCAGKARDVRAMPIKIITVSKENSKGAILFAKELLEKLERYAPVSTVTVKPNPRNSADPAVQRETEGEKVLKALDSRDFVVVLDERGKELRSEDLANLIAAAGDEGRPMAFCIGGPYGHSDAVRSRADRMVRLSAMVLNHQVAVVVLLEQLYRAWTILRGVPYHH